MEEVGAGFAKHLAGQGKGSWETNWWIGGSDLQAALRGEKFAELPGNQKITNVSKGTVPQKR